MTEKEIGDVLFILRVGLPGAYLNLTPADTAAMVALWHEMFRDSPAGLVAAAAKTYIWRSDAGRFPTPGNLRKEMEQIQRAIELLRRGSGEVRTANGAKIHVPGTKASDVPNAADSGRFQTWTTTLSG